MDRTDFVVAALAAGGENASFTPVQVQKLFFLLDREAASLTGGPHFKFSAYDYGPFDKAVYDTLETLAQVDMTKVVNTGRFRVYALSERGFQQGAALLSSLPRQTREYLTNVAGWVRKLSFEQLVAAIYNRYPEMKVNSVFRG